MKLEPIIKSPLETDAYKFSMDQCIFHQFNNYTTTWSFKCRNANVKFTKDMVQEIKEQIDHYCTLRFTEGELKWLENNLPWIHRDYLDFLRYWYPRREEIFVSDHNTEECTEAGYHDCGLFIEARGTWLNTSMYEIAILAIVNEVYFAFKYGCNAKLREFKTLTDEHIAQISGYHPSGAQIDPMYHIGTFSEFGMRRRYSRASQDYLISALKYEKDEGHLPGFVGTSNVYLAKKFDLKAVGTQAHEFIMCVGQGNHKHNPAYSNWYALDAWVKEYGILNGIALTDTIGTGAFLQDFGLTYATLFSGVRHDSGDPIEWGEKIIAHYEGLGIDPKTKTLLFSDSLNLEKAHEIKKYFEDRCKVAFGIGTFWSNPLPDALNIVMKVTECNGSPVAKLSDVEGKGMCKDAEYVEYLKRSIQWRMSHG